MVPVGRSIVTPPFGLVNTLGNTSYHLEFGFMLEYDRFAPLRGEQTRVY